MNLFAEKSRVALFGDKNDVAALYVGLRIAEAERLVKRTQSVHFNFVMAADVYAAE
jgi:hypothetical protein